MTRDAEDRAGDGAEGAPVGPLEDPAAFAAWLAGQGRDLPEHAGFGVTVYDHPLGRYLADRLGFDVVIWKGYWCSAGLFAEVTGEGSDIDDVVDGAAREGLAGRLPGWAIRFHVLARELTWGRDRHVSLEQARELLARALEEAGVEAGPGAPG